MRTLDKIKNEPSTQDALRKVRMAHGDDV
jgi:hypothetical protein